MLDTAGKEFTNADAKGKVLVLFWASPACETSKRVFSSGKIKKMINGVRGVFAEAIFKPVCSDDVDPKAFAEFLSSHGLGEYGGLCDRDTKFAKLLGAKTTCHAFLIDQDGMLRYNGAIDDDADGKKADAAENYVHSAARQHDMKEIAKPALTDAYGTKLKVK